MTELIVPVCHVDVAEKMPVSKPADLARHTLISYNTEPYSWNEWLTKAGEPKLKPAGTLSFEQMYFALQAAESGLGLVLVPLFLAIDDILAGRLCTPFGLQHAMERRYYANAATNNPVIRQFHEWLKREGKATEHSILVWGETLGNANASASASASTSVHDRRR